ncbi:MAG: hypothetical protein ACRERD_22680 [Candidatus Binatia bacterium]
MADIRRVGDLELNQDLDFQHRSWIVQRIGWAVMALVVLAALLGLLGPGPLSSTVVGIRGAPLWGEYDRFAHYQAPTQLRIHLQLGTQREGEARVWLDRNYLDSVQVKNVIPQPDSVEAGPDRLIYTFRVSEPSQPAIVTFYLEPEQIGPLSGRVGLDRGQSLSFRQFIYP